jgi:hypothetical protein
MAKGMLTWLRMTERLGGYFRPKMTEEVRWYGPYETSLNYHAAFIYIKSAE